MTGSTTPTPVPRRSQGIFRLLVALLTTTLVLVLLAGCGSDPEEQAESGIRLANPADAAELLTAEAEELVLIDVRTPEEFDEAHLDGALLIDFYSDDFVDTLAELDRNQRYVIYCRSGNRSGQTRDIMADLGFTDVVDIDGGIVAWQSEGLPTAG